MVVYEVYFTYVIKIFDIMNINSNLSHTTQVSDFGSVGEKFENECCLKKTHT